jgi:preprotein translocase subunit SecE
MSRAVRRQQARSGEQAGQAGGRDGGRQRPPRLGASGGGGPPTRGARPVTKRRGLRLPAWLDDIIAELKKVTWPTPAEARYLTTVVIIVAVAVGIALGVIDIFFNWFIDRLLLQ